MKRTLSLLLVLALLSGLLTACGEERGAATPAPSPVTGGPSPSADDPAQPSAVVLDGPTVAELAEAVFSASGCEDPEAVERVNAQEDAGSLDFYVENAYGLEAGDWEDAAIIRAAGASAFEIAVVRCADDGAAVRAATKFMSYTFTRQGDFTGYAPDQADMAANDSVSQRGPYAALFICPEPDLADAAFAAALDGDGPSLPSEQPSAEPSADPSEDPSEETPEETPSPSPSAVQWPVRYPYTQPNEDDMSLYDTSAIRAAWASGDPSGLSDYDRAVYDAAKPVLDTALRDGMSGYEKEEALYDWVVRNVDYDWSHNDVMASTPRESFTPYGGLVNRTAVCLGYATTFQLLMDLAGVECITVVGAAFQSTGDHAWNMVRLNGNWYCVDATWDANNRELNWGESYSKEFWDYFNVTSAVMAASNHQWDYANTPEAVTEGHGA